MSKRGGYLMKYDLSKKLTKGAVRTINAFTKSMFELLAEKAFENITANEICLRSGYPRATFYNYFEDKYDLLTCCWIKLSQTISFEGFRELGDMREVIYVYADRIYDLGISNLPLILKILSCNNETGYMFTSLKFFMNNKIRELLESGFAQDSPVPRELMAAHHSNTLILVMEWAFLNLNKCTKENVREYLDCLLGATLEKTSV